MSLRDAQRHYDNLEPAEWWNCEGCEEPTKDDGAEINGRYYCDRCACDIWDELMEKQGEYEHDGGGE